MSLRACFLLIFLMATHSNAAETSPRERLNFNAGWRFHQGDPEQLGSELDYSRIKDWLLASSNQFTKDPAPQPEAELTTTAEFAKPDFDDGNWRKVDLPHDWGIEGPFLQEYPGTTGKLAWWGKSWYRKKFDVPAADKGRRIYLDIDGAMSYSSVWVNGRFAGGWPYGYSSYRVDLTPFVRYGESNTISMRLDNPPDSSRWYPGGGIYRNVWLVKSSPVHVSQWGTTITTPEVTAASANVQVGITIENQGSVATDLEVKTELFQLIQKDGKEHRVSATGAEPTTLNVEPGKPSIVTQSIPVKDPKRWSLASPNLYVAVTSLTTEGKLVDQYETVFGIRKIEFTADRGFLLNGEHVRLQGVSNHHDLGSLGSAFNLRAAERQLEILKEMGVNALRTTHNPAAPELLDLCDRMGILVVGESFDCWIWGKTPNDYGLLFNDWSERDLRAMIRRDRNHPSVIMWSVGNEIVNVEAPENDVIAKRLVRIVHEEDTTRAATAGVNNTPVAFNGYQKNFDVFGFNYRSMFYEEFHRKNPTIPVYGSETASTVSSRGEYFFPLGNFKHEGMSHFQMSSYDLFAPLWAWPPDAEFAWLDKTSSTMGEFVWTGFDYLGEPTPYSEDWIHLTKVKDPAEQEKLTRDFEEMAKRGFPSRSSYFGIVDLAGFKKDRFYLYQARWRPDLPMAHILPHWTWPGREGQVTPVHVYTSGDEAEVFLNGKSLGRKKRAAYEYRLRWDEVKYEPGEVKVVAYRQGQPWAEESIRTAGATAKIGLQADRAIINADGTDLSFITTSITDKNGVIAPGADNTVTYEVSGPAELVATDNGDAISHVSFKSKDRPAFHGLALAIVRSKAGAPGKIRVKASSPGLTGIEIIIESVATAPSK